jgi:mannose/fructose/N-acetylgalactosamine-specific phosphotransferase system component IIB
MLKLIRIDDRLVHGQVAFTWTPALGIDCIIVANDRSAGDEFLKMTMGLAKPAGVRLLIKTVKETPACLHDPKNKSANILLIIESVKDAYTLCAELAEIRSINFGGIRAKAGAKPISKAISLTDADIDLARELLQKGIELEIRQVPTDKKQLVENLI